MDNDGLSPEEIQFLLQRKEQLQRRRDLQDAGAGGIHADSKDRRLAVSTSAERFRLNDVSTETDEVLDEVSDRWRNALDAAFESILRSKPQSILTRSEICSYGEFVLCCEHPTCLFALGLDPAADPSRMEISLPLMFASISRMLGGSIDNASPDRLSLTDIERALAQRIAETVVTHWPSHNSLAPEGSITVGPVESQPSLPEPQLARQSVASLQFQLQLGQVQGTVRIAMPWKITRPHETSDASHAKTSFLPPDGSSSVEVAATVTRMELSREAIDGLQPGDILTTDAPLDASLEIAVDGQPRFTARAGTAGGRKAICIDGPSVEPPASDQSANRSKA